MTKSGLYERDFYAWANEQARLLREGSVAAADLANIAEEMDCLARGERRILVDLLRAALALLVNWRYRPDMRGQDLRLRITLARHRLTDHLDESPSLSPLRAGAMATAYRSARRDVLMETDLTEAAFPTACPWSFEQVMDEAFWPEEPPAA